MKKYIALFFALFVILIIGCNYDTASTISILSDTPINSVFPIGSNLVRQPDANYNPNELTTLIEKAQSNQDTERLIELRRLMAYHFYHNTNNIDTVKTLLDDLAEFCISRGDTLNFLLVQNDIIETFVQKTNDNDVRKATANAIIKYADKNNSPDMLAEGYRSLGRYYLFNGDSKELGRRNYHIALDLFKKTNNIQKQIRTYQNLTTVADSDSMSFYALKAWKMASDAGYDFEINRTIAEISVYYMMSGVYDLPNTNAYALLCKELIESQPKMSEKDKGLVSKLLSRLGIFGESDFVGIQYLEDAVELQEELKNIYVLSICHKNLCVTNGNVNNYDEAIKHGVKSVELAEVRNDTSIIIRSIYDLHSNYVEMEDYEKAIECTEYAYDIAQQIDKSTYSKSIEYVIATDGLAYVYFSKGELNKAIEVLKGCLKNEDLRILSDDSWAFANTNFFLGLCYLQNKDYDEAEEYFKKAEQRYRSNDDRWSYMMGTLYLDRDKNYKKALEYYQEALSKIDSNVSPDSLESQPQFSSIQSFENLFFILQQKARALRLLYEKKGDEKLILLSEATVENALTIFYDLLADDSRSFLNKSSTREKVSSLFTEAFIISNLRYTGKERNDRLFELIEKSKFFRSKTEMEIYSPNSLYSVYNQKEFLKKQTLAYEITLMDSLLIKNTNDPHLDSIRTFYESFINDKKEEKELELVNIPDLLGLGMRSFYEVDLMYNVEELQGLLADSTAFLNYLFGDDEVCVQVVEKNKVHNVVLPIPELPQFKGFENNSLTELCKDVIDSISNRNSSQEKLHTCLAKLYDLVFREIEKNYLSKNVNTLIVSSDGLLNKLPFDLLLRSENGKVDSEGYLMNKYTISLASSAEVWILQTTSDNGGNKKVFAEASYFPDSKEDRLKKQEAKYPNEVIVMSDMQPLTTSEPMIDLIAKEFKGTKTLKGKRANLKNTVKHIREYDILIFSTHARANETKPDSSYIALSFINGKQEALFERDIHDLDSIPADLVVLAACETGGGRGFRGTGVFSLAKAFQEIKSKSQVYSLWEIPENTTNAIIVEFMLGLKEGLNKSEALRRAKRKLLRGELTDVVNGKKISASKYNHPYFWSGIVVSGDISSLEYLQE